MKKGKTCASVGFHKTNGFSVKSRIVYIQVFANIKAVDLSGCKTTGQVAMKVEGSEVFHNNEQLENNVLLDDVIMRSTGECRLYVLPSLASKPVFAMSQAVSAAAAPATNNNPILNRTVEEYGICSHALSYRNAI